MITRRSLFVVAMFLFAWGIWGYDIVAPDEPYFAEGAREMIDDGRWIVIHVNGVVSTDKPPLFFWLIALLSLPLQEVTSLTARLPSVLAALGTVALTVRLGRRLFDERVGLHAGFLLAVTYLFWDKSRSAQTDMTLCFFIMVSLTAFEAFRAGDASARRSGLLFWTSGALAVLTKGPVGILLPLCIALLIMAFDRDLRRLLSFAPLSGPLAFAAILACWIVPANLWNPELYTVGSALKTHFVERAIYGMHHVQPFWYYAKVLPPVLMPWTLLVPGAIWAVWRRRDRSTFFLLVIIAFVLLFFSVSTEKRTLYVLPSFPAYALALAVLLDAVREGRISARWIKVPQLVLGGLLVAVAAVLVFKHGDYEILPSWIALVLAGGIGLTGLATLFVAMRRSPLHSVGATWVGMAVIYLFVASAVFPAFDPVKSARSFSEQVAAETAGYREAGGQLLAYWTRNLPKPLAFYTRGLYTVETLDLADLERHLRSPTRAWALINVDKAQGLAPDVREKMVTVLADRLSRMNIVLVHNGAPPAAP